ncbi:ABC transporter ATP-binding protein [Fuchsiella alkaliacetigena]|uniref:ABC transporter ATP-binding protein n=1 Tax=Fuchsiella alkaliacetigena TaxID=957042 RepID=UPI00200B490F|nr:ABC transporter ATP-binding protein [Fuchsiella alkaliacetigena]MCK8824143.1 ABC transporter ATP-binding protein [Fuchsiella alkaliacetigena]
MPLLKFEAVEKIYQQGEIAVPALRGIDLIVEKGEFTTVFGPSGSGKTTLLNIIGALDKPTKGRVEILDQSIKEMDKNQLAMLRRKHIGFIFQSYNLIPVLTAYENVEFALRIAEGSQGPETKERVTNILTKVGLGEMLARKPNQLSGGQKQRVAIARALVKEPDLVLADEPTANLDSETSQEVLELMLKMNQELKTTFIFSTHDPLVMKYAHRLLEIRDGMISKEERRG